MKSTVTLQSFLKLGDLLTTVLLTKVENVAIGLLIGASFLNENIVVLLTDKQKVADGKLASVSTTEEQAMSANAVLTIESGQNAIV